MVNATASPRPTYLGPKDVAAFLGIHYCSATRIMDRMAANDKAQVIKIAGKKLINEADFYAALKNYRI